MHRRGFAPIILLIVAAILAVGIGSYALFAAKKAANAPSAPAAQRAPSSTQAIQSPTPSPSTAPAPPSSTGSTPAAAIDTSNWKTFTSKYGWSMKYPPDWDVFATAPIDPEQSASPIFEGPANCGHTGGECGILEFDVWPSSPLTSIQQKKFADLLGQSAKENLLSGFINPSIPGEILLQQGDTKLGGEPAYWVIYRQNNPTYAYSIGNVVKVVEAKHDGKFYSAGYQLVPAGPTSSIVYSLPDEWQLNSYFDAILSTCRFIP